MLWLDVSFDTSRLLLWYFNCLSYWLYPISAAHIKKIAKITELQEFFWCAKKNKIFNNLFSTMSLEQHEGE